MIRAPKFLISSKLYAVDLTSLRVTEHMVTLGAVWFRRRNGITAANIGHLWDIQRPAPADAAEFLARHDDGRYGGTCEGRWDGERYWGAQEPDVIAQHLELLRPMLAKFPVIPAGYNGWWRF